MARKGLTEYGLVRLWASWRNSTSSVTLNDTESFFSKKVCVTVVCPAVVGSQLLVLAGRDGSPAVR
jgi:ABC-type uncharacterized transport system permease subunit